MKTSAHSTGSDRPKCIRLLTVLSLAALFHFELSGQVVHHQSDSVYASLPATPDGIHIRFRKDHWDQLDLKTGEITKHHVPDIGSMTRYYQPILLGYGLFLVHELGGLVYKVTDDSVFRIDKSFDHRMQNNSVIFQRNDTIMRHGGYGFWSARQLIVYFDRGTGSWEPYPYRPGGTVPPGLSEHQFILRGDSLLVFGGLIADPSDPLMPRPNHEVWCFDFKSRYWSNLGNANWDNTGYPKSQIPTFQIDDHSYLLRASVASLAITPKDNILALLIPSEKTRFWMVLPHVLPFHWNGLVYFYRNKSTLYELCSVPSNELHGLPTEKRDWIRTPLSKNRWLLYGGGLALLMIAGYRYNRRKVKDLLKAGIRQGKQLELESSERRLIEAFLINYPANLLVAEIDNALDTSRKSRDVQNQRRSQVIRSVNSKFMVFAQTESTLILSKRSETDGRMVEYFIEPELYSTLLGGLGND